MRVCRVKVFAEIMSKLSYIKSSSDPIKQPIVLGLVQSTVVPPLRDRCAASNNAECAHGPAEDKSAD